MIENSLIFIIISPIVGVLILTFIPTNRRNLLKVVALNFSSLPFFGFLCVGAFFKKSIAQCEFVTKTFCVPYLNLNLTLGVDGISLFFLLLTTMLIPICILISWSSVKKDLKNYLIAFLLLEFFLIGVFCILDLLLFYIFFILYPIRSIFSLVLLLFITFSYSMEPSSWIMAEILRVYELIELHSHLEDILLNMQTIVVHRLRIKIKKLGLQKRFATTSSEENTKKILFSVKIGKKKQL